MHSEVQAATAFLSQYLKHHPKSAEIKKEIYRLLLDKYRNHWDSANPIRGNGYRALNFSTGTVDEILLKIAQKFSISDIQSLFPQDMVLWVDPSCVSYRVGDYGYVTVLYEGEKEEANSEALEFERRGHYQAVY